MEHSFSWDNWLLDVEVGNDIDKDLGELVTSDDEEEFLRDILKQQEPALSCETESESQPFVRLCSNEMNGCDDKLGKTYPRPRTYIMAFDKSTIIPATTPQQCSSKSTNINNSKKRNNNNNLLENHHNLINSELQPKPKGNQGGGKKTRSDSQTVDHIMAERRRRQDLTQKFIALSATIPGLKKTHKTSILGEAINYVKQLQERVKELEEGSNRGTESTLILKKILCAKEDPKLSEKKSEECSELLPCVKAKVLEIEVLIDIICEKENGIELKILDLLQRLHLFVTGSSALPIGNSTLVITIIAQMGEAYNMNVNDLVKTLQQVLLNKLT